MQSLIPVLLFSQANNAAGWTNAVVCVCCSRTATGLLVEVGASAGFLWEMMYTTLRLILGFLANIHNISACILPQINNPSRKYDITCSSPEEKSLLKYTVTKFWHFLNLLKSHRTPPNLPTASTSSRRLPYSRICGSHRYSLISGF